jgi:hypothetical protein
MINFANLDNRWLAVQVRAGWEMRVARSMRRRGYEDFVPSYRQERSWSDRTITLDIPIFTGYVFIRFCVNNKQPVGLLPHSQFGNASLHECAFG